MPHNLLHHHTGNTMEHHLGIFGFVITWFFNALAWTLYYFIQTMSRHTQILQDISLVCAIIVSVMTIFYYLGRFIIQWDELRKSRLFKKLFGKIIK
jgi:hypothetical protein